MSQEPARVLLVEDDQDDVLFFRRAVREVCPETLLEVAPDGMAAIRCLSNGLRSPDFVVLDLKLPCRSGIEVLEWIRSEPRHRGLRVVVMSSSGEPSDVRRAGELGIEEYLVKPTTYHGLVDAVRSLAAKWRRS